MPALRPEEKALRRKSEEEEMPSGMRNQVEKLKHPDWNVRAEGARGLVGFRDRPSAVPYLINALQDKHPQVREDAADSLRWFSDERAIPHLMETIQDPKESVRKKAMWALRETGLNIFGHEIKSEEARAFQAVVEHLQPEEDPRLVRDAYLAALKGQIDELGARQFVEKWRAVKGKPELLQREGNIAAPSMSKEERLQLMVRQQMERLKHPDERVRAFGAYALGQIGNESHIPFLAEKLKSEEDYRAKVGAVLGLAKLGERFKHEATVPPLIRALDYSDADVEKAAVSAMIRVGRVLPPNVKGKEARNLQIVGQYFREDERPLLVRQAYRAAVEGKFRTAADALSFMEKERAALRPKR